MRIGDNNPAFYGLGHQAPAVAKPAAAELSAKTQTPPLSPSVPVTPVDEAKKQQLLQRYLQAEGVDSGVLSLSYSQQRAVERYSQQAQLDELQQLQAVLGIDEYA